MNKLKLRKSGNNKHTNQSPLYRKYYKSKQWKDNLRDVRVRMRIFIEVNKQKD